MSSMKKGRRHSSLIPLSREHHYALMLCLRINRGLPDHGTEADWLLAKVRQVTLFFESDLRTHFKAEEEVLFPAMREISSAELLIAELRAEHRKLEELGERLRTAEPGSIAALLSEFAALLEAHIRKEERLLFPIFELELSGPAAERIERDIQSLIGTALEPKQPELLEA